MNICLFQQIIKSLPRRKIATLVASHGSDKWMKRFSTYDHLVAMIYAQLCGQTSLRDLEISFNASPARHYHLGSKGVKRSTLSDANASRPSSVFEAILSVLLNETIGKTSGEARELVRLLDSTIIGLFAKTHHALRFRGNNAAIKLHLLYDDSSQCPAWFEITPARLHDSKVCDHLPIEAGMTYVFDRAYNNASFWSEINAADAIFVTRPKTSLTFDVKKARLHPGTMVVADETIRLGRNPGKKYPELLRRVEIFDEERGEEIAFITNDFDRDPIAIAELYKRRWKIELFFKWIKQNLKIKKFLAKNPKAIRLQIITALIAYVLLQNFHQKNRLNIPLKRLAAVVHNYAFNLGSIAELIKPPDKRCKTNGQNQLKLNFPGQ